MAQATHVFLHPFVWHLVRRQAPVAARHQDLHLHHEVFTTVTPHQSGIDELAHDAQMLHVVEFDGVVEQQSLAVWHRWVCMEIVAQCSVHLGESHGTLVEIRCCLLGLLVFVGTRIQNVLHFHSALQHLLDVLFSEGSRCPSRSRMQTTTQLGGCVLLLPCFSNEGNGRSPQTWNASKAASDSARCSPRRYNRDARHSTINVVC